MPFKSSSSGKAFFGHDELAQIRSIRAAGKLDEAEVLLKAAMPSAAVLDELRKIASTRAREAKNRSDWPAVIEHLTNYEKYADSKRDECVAMVNQEPPDHTPTDKKLLRTALEEADK